MSDTVIIIVFIVACLIAVGMLINFFMKKINKSKPKKEKAPKQKKEKAKKEKKQEKVNANYSLSVVDKYMFRKELLFWKFLNSILPKEYVACPKVAVSAVVNPAGDKRTYNQIQDKFIDYIICDEQNMHPKLVIDLYDSSYINEKLEESDPVVTNALKSVGLKILCLNIQAVFDKNEIKKQIYDALNIVIEEKE